jgi:CHAT domain-containing protein
LNSAQPDAVDSVLLKELYDALFPANIAREILSAEHLIIIPDGPLALIPWEVLSPAANTGSYPIARIPSKYFPSAEAFRAARTDHSTPSWTTELLGIGDPITSARDERYQIAKALTLPNTNGGRSSNDTPQLVNYVRRGLSLDRIPGTTAELESIRDLIDRSGKKAEVRLGSEATKAMLNDTDLRQYRYLHFATHGLLPADSGLGEPALVFSLDGSTDETATLLSMSDILSLALSSDMVVLSACDTGSGKVSKTEGVSNLGRAFMAAGAHSVTVSLWQVSDESTVELMTEMYRGLLAGLPKDVALAQARQRTAKDYSSPFYWAPFVMMGD